MNKQEKFEDYMNNKLAPWALKMVIFANVFVINLVLIDIVMG